jgi:hypothetical protein
MDLTNCHLNHSYYDNDTLMGTVHYARTGDYVSTNLTVDRYT